MQIKILESILRNEEKNFNEIQFDLKIYFYEYYVGFYALRFYKFYYKIIKFYSFLQISLVFLLHLSLFI